MFVCLFSAADFETLYPVLPFHYSHSAKGKPDFLVLSEMQKAIRKPLPRILGKKISQTKTSVCSSDIFLLVPLVIACTALTESVGKWGHEGRI